MNEPNRIDPAPEDGDERSAVEHTVVPSADDGHDEDDESTGVERAVVPASLDEAFVKERVRARLLGRTAAVYVGRFEILQRLGSGGEGSVFEARDRQSGARVALKQLHPTYSARGGSLKREFRALANLVHPNLVTLYELYQIEAERFYTMELVLGADFVDYVRAGEQARAHARLRKALPQLFAGLDTLHRAGKVHRDLKPSNVLVRPDDHLVILDYGLVVDEHVPGGRLRFDGTPTYAAPEQIAGRALAASDLYAVGVMLFHALTGRLPVRAGAEADDLRPSRVAPEVPADLDALCAALRAPEPSARPTAADARAWCLGDLAELPVEPAARASAPSNPPEVFVGRAALLQSLHALADAAPKAPCILLLHGESGIGKSALLRRFCSERGARGAIVLSGQCYEREHLPFKALDAVVERLVLHVNALPDAQRVQLSAGQRAALVRLFPAFDRLRVSVGTGRERGLDGVGELRLRAFAAVRALFQALARDREVVFAVDDLQWSDLDSVDLLSHVLGGDDAPAICLVGATRSVELQTNRVVTALRAALRALPAGQAAAEIAVGPLASDEAAALLETLLSSEVSPEPSRSEREACIAQAAGMPFALYQVAEHARESGLAAGSEAWLGAAIRLRADRCSPVAQQLLDVLAVAGRPLEAAITLASANLPATDQHAIMELCGRKLARFREAEDGRCLEIYHDLVRTAVTQAIAPAATRAIHRRIVDALTSHAPERPELLVEHLLGAEELERAGQTALVAAERAAGQLAWNRAADLLQTALRVLDAAALRAHDVYERLAAALAAAHRHREAAAAYDEAAAQAADEEMRRRLSGLAAQQHMRAGDVETGTAALRTLLREAGYRLPHTRVGALISYVLNRALKRLFELVRGAPRRERRTTRSERRMRVLTLAHTELWLREPLQASVVHAWAFREALSARDHHLLRAVAGEISQLTVVYGPHSERRARKLLAMADALPDAASSPYERATRSLARALYALQCKWHPREALRELDTADALLADCPGSAFERSWTDAVRDFALELTGETGELLASIQARVRFAEDPDDGYSQDRLLMMVPLMHLLGDDPDAAIAYMNARWTRAEVRTLIDYEVIVRMTGALLYRGDAAGAYQFFRAEWKPLRRSGLLSFHMMHENATYHRARNAAALYLRTGEAGLAREALAVVRGARAAPPVMRAFYRLIEASVAFADGDLRRCRAVLGAALADSLPESATAWCARLRLAQLDGAASDEAAARAWFRARAVRNPDRWTSLSMPGPCAPHLLPSADQPGG